MIYEQLAGESYTDAVMRYQALWAEAIACGIDIKQSACYVDQPNRMVMTDDRLQVRLFMVDELTGCKGWHWLDVSAYTVEQMQDAFCVHFPLKRKYTPYLTIGLRGSHFYQAIGYSTFGAMARGMKRQQLRRQRAL